MKKGIKEKTIVISQPYFFPWLGMFEQINIADVFVYYDDVQFTKGHFQDRVQIKTSKGFNWLTVPKAGLKLGQKIQEVKIDYKKDWRHSHVELIKQSLNKTPFLDDVLVIVECVYSEKYNYLADLTIASTDIVLDYFNLKEKKQMLRSSCLNISGTSTDKVLSICKSLDATTYATGMGALKYFDFDLFEKENITVKFIDYAKIPYQQQFDGFNPYVSILDLIANKGPEGIEFFKSKLIYWKDFIKTNEAKEYLKKG